MTAERHLVWEWVRPIGLESTVVRRVGDRIAVYGVAVADLEGGATRVAYELEYDERWVFGRAAITIERGASRSRLAVERSPAGDWRVDGADRPDLAGASDLDIQVTPLTNTSALRQLALQPGESKVSDVAYVNIDDGGVSKIGQEYTRLDRGESPARYRYRNLATQWTGEMRVDEDGFVLDYGPWRRRI